MKWEYKTIKMATTGVLVGGKLDESQFDARLNELGQEGWELAMALDTNQVGGMTRDVVVIFKRPEA